MGRAPAQARPPGRGNPGQRGVGGCSLGSLASELADRSEPARKAPAACFTEWEAYLADGFAAMREDSLISRDADPAELAVTVMTALPGRLTGSRQHFSDQMLEGRT